MINFLTIDVEDHISLLYKGVMGIDAPVSDRVIDCTRRMLDVLARRGVKATCFCLGNVARARPGFIREVRDAGMEVGSHGMEHILYFQHPPGEVKRDLADSRVALEDAVGEPVRGFRAAHFNVSLSRPEIIEAIIEAGYEYDSSIFPIGGRRYGSVDSPRYPYRIRCQAGELLEFPPATVEVIGRRVPVAGGGYLRHFPYSWNRKAIRAMNDAGIPATVYLHPYECDLEAVEIPPGVPASARLRMAWINLNQNHNRKHTLQKLHRLTSDFKLTRIEDILASPEAGELPVVEVE